MKEFKKWTATALALSLCLTLAACSSDDSSTSTDSTPATSTADTASTADATDAEGETEEESGEESTDDATDDATEESDDEEAGEVTLDTYLEDLLVFSEEVAEVEQKLIESGDAAEGLPSDEEAIELQIEILEAMSDALSTAGNVTAPEEIAALHDDFVSATDDIISAIADVTDLLAEGFDVEDEESVATYNELSEVYLAAFGPLSDSLVAIMDELQAQMS